MYQTSWSLAFLSRPMCLDGTAQHITGGFDGYIASTFHNPLRELAARWTSNSVNCLGYYPFTLQPYHNRGRPSIMLSPVANLFVSRNWRYRTEETRFDCRLLQGSSTDQQFPRSLSSALKLSILSGNAQAVLARAPCDPWRFRAKHKHSQRVKPFTALCTAVSRPHLSSTAHGTCGVKIDSFCLVDPFT